MRITERDVKLVRDVSLSYVVSRDQLIKLGYFGTVCRVNTRVRKLVEVGFLRRIETPFFAQSLYSAGANAREIVGERIAEVIARRSASPRFLQHALCVTNSRIALLGEGAKAWRFEPQVRQSIRRNGKTFDVRPDGLALFPDRVVAVEADLGHVAPTKFKEKLLGYSALAESSERPWGFEAELEIRVFTTGPLRAESLRKACPRNPPFSFVCRPFRDHGVPWVGSWS